jgi:hypothetical protein
MQLGNVVFFELDGIKAITIYPGMEQHLLKEMLQSVGTLAVAENWEAFWQLWQNNRI